MCSPHKERSVFRVYTKENGVWKDAKDNQYPIDQEKINDILDDVAEVKASKLVVTDPEDISQYQLDKPSYQIELKDRAGTTKTLTIGMESVAAEGYYAYCGNKNKIYAIPSNITDSLSYTKQEMMELPEQPDINASYVFSSRLYAEMTQRQNPAQKIYLHFARGWSQRGRRRGTIKPFPGKAQQKMPGQTARTCLEEIKMKKITRRSFITVCGAAAAAMALTACGGSASSTVASSAAESTASSAAESVAAGTLSGNVATGGSTSKGGLRV